MTTSNGTTEWNTLTLKLAMYEAEERLRELFRVAEDIISDLDEENDMLCEQNDDLSHELAKLQQEIYDLRQASAN
jgi:predicted  nucleic acid-binding Zn-ribbon protein